MKIPTLIAKISQLYQNITKYRHLDILGWIT